MGCVTEHSSWRLGRDISMSVEGRGRWSTGRIFGILASRRERGSRMMGTGTARARIDASRTRINHSSQSCSLYDSIDGVPEPRTMNHEP